MRYAINVTLTLFTFATFIYGQPDTTKTEPEYGWKQFLVVGLTMTQIAFTDWTQGGENALAYAITANGKSVDEGERVNWTNIYKFAFGQTRLAEQGLRKTDDIIDISSVFTYKLGSYVNPYASITVKSQFAKGFVYKVDGNDSVLSKFFDPAYLTQSVGFGYQPIKQVKTRLGIGIREVITNRFNQYTDDPSTPEIEKTTFDGGIESVTNIDWQIEENIRLLLQLELFSPFKTIDEVVVRSSSTINAKVNKYITAIVSLQLINEKRVTPRTQVKESMALGFSYAIF